MPILARLTNIPYYHFTTLYPEHAAVLSSYAHHLLQEEFGDKFKSFFNLLDCYPSAQPSLSTTYTIKAIHYYLEKQNDYQNFYGFNTKDMPIKILGYLVGRIHRISFVNVKDWIAKGGLPISSIERDMIEFYTLLFAGKLEKEFENMKKHMESDF